VLGKVSRYEPCLLRSFATEVADQVAGLPIGSGQAVPLGYRKFPPFVDGGKPALCRPNNDGCGLVLLGRGSILGDRQISRACNAVAAAQFRLTEELIGLFHQGIDAGLTQRCSRDPDADGHRYGGSVD
jgi:hypothetical protein